MLVPNIFGEDLFDDFMRYPTNRTYSKPAYEDWSKILMKTDIREVGEDYEICIDLPGFDKEAMKIHLKDGYLTVEASRTDAAETADESGKYVRRERYNGSCSRSFFIGKGIKDEDIHAKYENGVLRLTFPKEPRKEVEEKKFIAIEG